MSDNQEIELRIKNVVSLWQSTTDKKMFDGVCHLINGNMFCGVYKDFLILRLGEEEATRALQRPNVKPFDLTGRLMKGWVMVAQEGFQSDQKLEEWLSKSKSFVEIFLSK